MALIPYSMLVNRQQNEETMTVLSNLKNTRSLAASFFYKDEHDDIRCLVDSGSDESLFHSSVAENLSIDLESGEPRTYYPVGLALIKGYAHTVELQVHGLNERITIVAGFTEASELCLLGQSGFFENYEITFRGFEKTFEIRSRL